MARRGRSQNSSRQNRANTKKNKKSVDNDHIYSLCIDVFFIFYFFCSFVSHFLRILLYWIFADLVNMSKSCCCTLAKSNQAWVTIFVLMAVCCVNGFISMWIWANHFKVENFRFIYTNNGRVQTENREYIRCHCVAVSCHISL